MAKGSRIIAIGHRRSMRNLFQVVGRHGYDRGVILVPGVPEAASAQDAEDALLDWLDWLDKRERPNIHLIGVKKDKTNRSSASERFERSVSNLDVTASANEYRGLPVGESGEVLEGGAS